MIAKGSKELRNDLKSVTKALYLRAFEKKEKSKKSESDDLGLSRSLPA